jgi:undecaprenyl-diphosphatase
MDPQDSRARIGFLRSRLPLSPHAARLSLWLGGAALLLGSFLAITRQLAKASWELGLDEALLLWLAGLRTPVLTKVLVDVTALGSGTIVTLFTLVALVVLLLVRDRYAAIHLAAASAGAGLLVAVLKNVIERERPSVVPALTVSGGFSYPSGHSLASAAMYLTIGILVCRHLTSARARVALLGMTAGIILLIGVSRMYLGVHYPSDVASGMCLGAAWALLLAGGFSFFSRRARLPQLVDVTPAEDDPVV